MGNMQHAANGTFIAGTGVSKRRLLIQDCVDTEWDDECWEWPGSHSAGYGTLRFEGAFHYAHRVAYEYRYGPVPAHLELDHFVCNNKGCWNPEHLKPVTRSENIGRAFRLNPWH